VQRIEEDGFRRGPRKSASIDDRYMKTTALHVYSFTGWDGIPEAEASISA
jgi:hypothetical protein